MRDWRILKTQVLGAGCALRLPTAVTRSVAGRPYDSAFTQSTLSGISIEISGNRITSSSCKNFSRRSV